MADDGDIPDDEAEFFDTDAGDVKPKQEDKDPPYRPYPESKVAVGKGVGAYWKNQRDAALATNNLLYAAWNEVLKYYNHHHMSEMTTSNQGRYKRGDGSENIIISNVNTLLP